MAKSIYSEDDTQQPIYGDPGLLPDDDVQALAQRSRQRESDDRKALQAKRSRIMRSKHGGDIECELERLYSREHARTVKKYVTVTANPFAGIVEQVVQLYRGGAIRRVDGITSSEQEAFDKIVSETGIDVLAQSWAQTGYAVGPQFVIPVVRRGVMRLLSPAPESCDVVLDVADPTGDPVAVAYASGQKTITVVDAVAHRTFAIDNALGLREIEALRIEHGAGDMPAAALRFTPAVEDTDWWDMDANARLTSGAMEVGRIVANLAHLRVGQHGKLLTMTGPLASMPRGQRINDPTGPIMAPTDTEGTADQVVAPEINALDFDTDPINHLRHVRWVVEQMAESTGVPVTVESGGDKWDYSYDYDALGELRKGLVWWASMWERQLWTFVIHMARAQKHPLASKLPTPEQVSDGFYVTFPPLHRKFSDPLQEQKYYDWLLKVGAVSFVGIARRFLGNRSDTALKRQLRDNIEVNGEFWDFLAKRNIPAGAGPDGKIQTVTQAQGAQGGASTSESGDDDTTTA